MKHVNMISCVPALATTNTNIPEEVQNKVALETALLAFIVALLKGILPLLDKS